MAFYQTGSHWSNSDSSLTLPIRTLSSSDTWTTLNLSNPVILTSTSLDRLSFTDLAPVFPAGHGPPLFVLMDIRAECGMVGGKIRNTPREGERTMITAPTVPRMKVILQEKIVVKEWTATVQPQAPPDHIPWNGLGHVSSAENISEEFSTSIHSPIAGAPSANKRPTQLSDTCWGLKTSRRNALVLEPYGTQRGLDVADASVIECNLVGEAAERRSVHSEITGGAIEKQTSVPQSSFYPMGSKRHLNLAVRRGHQAFPSLKLQEADKKKRRDITSFDSSIPTAFRGSPTTYSPILNPEHYPPCQNLALAEMFENLREKCTTFSPRFSLPSDWFYRPRSHCKDMTKLTDTSSSKSQANEDEWAFAKPLMGMINTFSDRICDSGGQSVLLEDDKLELPILSRSPCDDAAPRSCLIRPSLVGPRLASSPRKVKKTVRFADTLILPTPKDTTIDFPAKHVAPIRPPSRTLMRPKRQHTALITCVAPSLATSVGRSYQSARNSWANTLLNRSSASPTPLTRRPLSHRYPTSPKLPLFLERNVIGQTLVSGSPLRQSYTSQLPLDIVGKSPTIQSPRAPTRPYGKRSFPMIARSPDSTKGNLKISRPMLITATPRSKQNSGGARRGDCHNSASVKIPVTSPLRGIFMKFK